MKTTIKIMLFILKLLMMWSIIMLGANTADMISTSWWVKAPYLLGMGVIANVLLISNFFNLQNK